MDSKNSSSKNRILKLIISGVVLISFTHLYLSSLKIKRLLDEMGYGMSKLTYFIGTKYYWILMAAILAWFLIVNRSSPRRIANGMSFLFFYPFFYAGIYSTAILLPYKQIKGF